MGVWAGSVMYAMMMLVYGRRLWASQCKRAVERWRRWRMSADDGGGWYGGDVAWVPMAVCRQQGGGCHVGGGVRMGDVRVVCGVDGGGGMNLTNV